MTAQRRSLLALCIAAATVLSGLPALAAALPEFGPSVQLDPAGPQTTVSKLRGKAVIVLFFKSPDKDASSSARGMLKEVQETFATNRTVALLALKTDGGGVRAAKGVLQSLGADTDTWIVGADEGGQYAAEIIGDQPWYYLVVGADGTIVERGQAFAKYHILLSVKPHKVEYHYNPANPMLLNKCGKLSAVLPADKKYGASVKGLARLAELGEAEKALALCSALLSKPAEKKAAGELLADLQPLVEKRVSDRIALLGDASGASAARYDAFAELAQMMKELKQNPLATKIAPALARARADPALQKEARAEAAYKGILPRVQKAVDRDKPRLAKELELLGKQNAGTKYGQLAAELAQRLTAEAPASDGK
jgi:hypothetical protein